MIGVLFPLLLLLLMHSLISYSMYSEPKYMCTEYVKDLYPCQCINITNKEPIIKCENVNLASLGGAFKNFPVDVGVNHIVISKSNINQLYGPLFKKVGARILTIEQTPIEVINEYTLYGINNTLEEFHILKSKLSSFPHLALQILGKLTHLNVDGSDINKLEKYIFSDAAFANHLEVLQIVNGLLYDIPIESFHPLGKLKTLDLHGNRIESIKKKQFKNLREVEVLDISSNLIKKVEFQDVADLTKLGWCNISKNSLTELQRGTFSRNAVLKVLDLSYNRIERLDGNSFRGMRFLRRLYLNDNNITNIGRGTFASLTRIGTIDISRNGLKIIDFQMFSDLNYVEIVNIAENMITKIEKKSFRNLYQTNINISHNFIADIDAFAFENCVNITILDLSYNKLTRFDKNVFDETTFATEFLISFNFITNLSQVPLHTMVGLKKLNASHNSLMEIPKNTFPKLYELHTIDLSHNNITTMANGVFQTLLSLRFLNLSHNQLENITTSMFGTLPTLLQIDLSHNSMIYVAKGSLIKLTSLRSLDLSNNLLKKSFHIPISLNQLDLSNNELTSISPDTWPIMNSLLFLDLSRNLLTDSLEAESFFGLNALQKLLLNQNGIKQVPFNSFSSIKTIQYLHLEENNITTLNKTAFGKLPVLFELNLFKNKINNIQKGAFDGLLQLLALNLSHNSLDIIRTETFIGLPSLRKLDISYNLLTKLDNKTHCVLDHLLSLETLNLRNNKVSFVSKKTFPSNPYIKYNLKYLDLSYNLIPVLTKDINIGTKTVISLNLSHNHINEIRGGVLGNFTSLKYLDLSYNELGDTFTEDDTFTLPNNLTELYLQNSKVNGLMSNKFVKNPKMEKIDLRGNNLKEFSQSLVLALKNGTMIFYENNPLNCNCAIMPFKHFLQAKNEISQELLNITCSEPNHLKGEFLQNIKDEALHCASEEIVKFNHETFSDLNVKSVSNDENIKLMWYVISNADIADFIIYVRNKQNVILYQMDVSYTERIANIPMSTLHNSYKSSKTDKLEICVISKQSNGEIGHWYQSQCVDAPNLQSNFLFSEGSILYLFAYWYVIVIINLNLLFYYKII